MSSFHERARLRLHYRDLVDGDSDGASPLLLVHGWMVSGAVWDPVLPSLRAGRRVVVPDQRGTGQSDKPAHGYTLTDYVDDLVALIDAAGLERCTVVGHSMGGQLAQLLAATRPDAIAKLILICPVPAAGVPLPDELAAMFRASGGDRAAQTQILNMACKTLGEVELATLLDDAATVSEACVAEAFDAWSAGGFADRLGEITSETHVIGTDDPFLPPEFLQAAIVEPIAKASFTHLPGPGHYPQFEATAATAEALLAKLG